VAEKPKKQINLEDAYNVMTPEDSRELYAQWAPTYDKTFVEETKYIYPAKIAEVLAKHMPADRSFSVIDIGCGTGARGRSGIPELRPRSDEAAAATAARRQHI
jgi:predicted TPR repeat methyltransferase